MAVPILTIVTTALVRAGVAQPGDPIPAADAVVVLDELNAIFDAWNAERQAVWCELFATWPLTPSLQPHTIGPTGTWVVPVRPVSIDGAAFVLASGSYQTIGVTSDPRWWAEQGSPGLATGAYYQPDVPNGSLFLGPYTAGSIRLMTRRVLADVLLTDSVALPQGYAAAIDLTLREAIADDFGVPLGAGVARRAGQARARIFSNNLIVPTLDARDAGIPGMNRGRWDARTGEWE